MTQTNDNQFIVFLSALRANRLCKKQRKTFNAIRATTTGQVQPGIAKNSAIDLIDCLERVNQSSKLVEPRKNALECLKSNGRCEALVQAYVSTQ